MGDVTITLSDTEQRLLYNVLDFAGFVCGESGNHDFNMSSDEEMDFLTQEIENWWCDVQGIPEEEHTSLIHDEDGNLIVFVHSVIDYFMKKLGVEEEDADQNAEC